MDHDLPVLRFCFALLQFHYFLNDDDVRQMSKDRDPFIFRFSGYRLKQFGLVLEAWCLPRQWLRFC